MSEPRAVVEDGEPLVAIVGHMKAEMQSAILEESSVCHVKTQFSDDITQHDAVSPSGFRLQWADARDL